MFTLQPTVVSKSSNPGLSLLSRGIGEEKGQHGQRKLEVCLEPEDYHNIQGRRFYLPPLQQHAWANEKPVSPREVRVHKTYTTRKGALLLYAEDLALTSKEGADGKKRSMEAEDSSYFNSISDLRNAVLSYGSGTRQQTFQPAASQVDPSHQPFLGFVHNKRSHGPYKRVRPGFSAKRYLANWSRSWDDSILNYLRSEGHIWDKNLFQQNVLAPNLYRRINDDLSLVPLPYRVTRNMLMSPGEFESLEFYRIRPDSADAGGYDDDEGYDADVDATEKGSKSRKKKSIQKPFNLPGSIAMIVRDMEQKPHAVQYEQLDEEQQRQVLQRLLLQSALHQQQHLRIIREENEKKKEEMEEVEGGEDSASSSQKRPMPPLSGQPKQRRTDTDMTTYGSPTFQVPDAQDIDMEQAIANLITSNSTNILGGAAAFTDQTILDMYSAMKGNTKKPPAPPPSTSPSQWPQGSKRRVKNSMYHTYPANFSGIQPLPPIQNSFEGNMGGGGDFMWPIPPPKQSTGPPVITMEPPTPQHPRLSGKSKFSQGWSSRSKSLSKSSAQSSSETNIWKAEINENDLLQEAEREDMEHERASSDQEVWIKSPRSSTKGSSKKASKHSAMSKESKGSGESIIALSINSHLSQSMENLASPVDQKPRFPAAGSVPARLRESMRSHKGSGRSSHGSVLLGDLGGDFLITGSKQGSSYAPSADSLADNVPSPVESPMPQEPPPLPQEPPSIEPSESLEVPDASTPDAEETKEPEINEEKSDVGSTHNVAGSPEDDDDAHSVKTDEFLSEADDTKTTERSVKLGQGVIDLPMSEPIESVRDKMSEKRSLPYSKKSSTKSSTQGSVKAESLHSGKDDDELGQLSDGEKEEEWPGQADQSKTESVTGQDDDQPANISSKKGGSMAGSDSEVETAGDGNEGEPGEGGDIKSGSRPSSLLEPPVSVAGSVGSRPRSVEVQLEQLVEAASVIVDEIMQRPKSGRDLAKDAMMAAEIWSAKLGELFSEQNDPERVRSAPYRRRQNSLDDDESDTSSMSSKQTKRIRRIHSAEAAVTLLRHLLKGSKSAEGKKEDAGGDGAQDSGPLGFGVTNLGVAEKKEAEKTALLVRAPPEPEKPADDADAKLNDELAKIVQETGLLEKRGSKSKKGSMSTKTSTKSSKSSKSSKSKKTKDGEEEEDKDAFIVGVPKDSKTDILLYKPMTPEPPKEEPKPPPKEKKKIQKKTKKPAPKQEKPKKTKKSPKEPTESPKDNKEALEEEAKLKAAKEKQEEEERKKKEEEEKAAKEAAEKEEDEEEEEDEGRASPESPEFIIVQDEFSDSDEEEQPPSAPSAPPELPVDEIKLEPSVSAAPSEDYSEITDFTEDSTNEGPNSISRSQAKAFKRAAEAEKRKAAVEKKRRERDEAKKRAQGEAERAERIKQEYEEEKRRKEAEALERAARAVQERERLASQEEERKRQAALAAERERRQQAEYKRKMEDMARKKREEDMKRKAEEEQRRKEEEERMRIEAEMLAAMEEAERLEFEKRRKAEELEAARIAEEERIKREIEDKIAEEKARLLAIEFAKQQKEVEARLAFNKELHSEANVFTHSQDMTRAFTWSYFELLEHLGIEIPDSLKDHYKEIAESKGDG